MSDLWIPIIGIICIAIVIIVSLYTGAREKQQLHTTLQLHLQNGGELSPTLLQQLGASMSQFKRDLRKGVLLTAIGIACLTSGLISGFFVVGAVFGVFPLFFGIAFCSIAILSKNE